MYPRARLTLTPPPAWARSLHSLYLPKLRSPSPAPGPSRCQCTPLLRSQPANPAAHSPRALLSLRLLPHPAFSSSLCPLPPPYSTLPSLLPSISPPPSPCAASPSFHLHLLPNLTPHRASLRPTFVRTHPSARTPSTEYPSGQGTGCSGGCKDKRVPALGRILFGSKG